MTYIVSNPHVHVDRPRAGITEVCLMIESDNDIAACEAVRVLTPNGLEQVEFDAHGVLRLVIALLPALAPAGLAAVAAAVAQRQGETGDGD